MVGNTIKVRTKVVLVVSELELFNFDHEINQSTVSFNFTETMSEAAYAALIAKLKAGDLTSDLEPT
jgi:hypothetical protein